MTFADPEIASVGLSEAGARARGIDVIVATTDRFHRGVLKLVGDRARGVLVGATLVTPHAGEILGELVLAIKLGSPLKTLADVIHPYPAFNRVLGGKPGSARCKGRTVRRGAIVMPIITRRRRSR